MTIDGKSFPLLPLPSITSSTPMLSSSGDATAEKLKGAGASKGDKDAEKAATEFEALLLHQMLTEMWKTVPKDGLIDSGRAGEYYQDMLNEELAKQISTDQPIGIKDEILKGLSHGKKS